jgi:hypothetical protein
MHSCADGRVDDECGRRADTRLPLDLGQSERSAERCVPEGMPHQTTSRDDGEFCRDPRSEAAGGTLTDQGGLMHFRATLQLHGKTATGIAVPDEIVAARGGPSK